MTTLEKKTKTTSKKQSMPTILSSDKCGSKKDGIYLCKRNYCCSKYGYCGKLVPTVILDANQDTVNVGNY